MKITKLLHIKVQKMLSILFNLSHFLSGSKFYELPMAEILFVCHDNDRGITVAGKKYSQILDSINEQFIKNGVSTITIASLFSKFFGKSAFGDVHIIHGSLLRAILIRKVLKYMFWKTNNISDPVVDCWFQVLQHLRPVYVFGIQPSRELCIAAHNLGIIVADVQHGILSDEGYYGMRNRINYGSPGWPSTFLAWDVESAGWLSHESSGLVKSYVIGNPWCQRFINQDNSDLLVSTILESSKLNMYKTPILVTLTWGLDYYGNFPKIGICQGLIDAIKQSKLECTWWIRMHPVQLASSTYPIVNKLLCDEFREFSNVIWDECTRLPLPLVLSHAALHITMMSAATVEAEWFDVRTALLYEDKVLLQKFLGGQISRGSAQLVKPTSESIISWIMDALSSTNIEQFDNTMISPRPLASFINEITNCCDQSRHVNKE